MKESSKEKLNEPVCLIQLKVEVKYRHLYVQEKEESLDLS